MEENDLILEGIKGFGHLGWAEFKDHRSRLSKFIACLSGSYKPAPGELMLHSTEADTTIDVNGQDTQKTLEILVGNEDSIVVSGKTAEGTTPELTVNTSDGGVSVTDFVKTEYFGGGSGRGAGSVQTVLQEAGQCIVCSAILQNRDIKNVKDIVDVGSQFSLGSGLNPVDVLDRVKRLCEDSIWNDTLINVAKLLLEKGYGDATFHYGNGDSPEPVTSAVGDAFNRCKLPGSFNINKWNPADIWVTRPGYEAYVEELNSIPKGSSVETLNSVVRKAFEEGKLVGISLKKANPEHLKYEKYNVGEGFSVDKIQVVKIDCKEDPKQQTGMNIVVRYVEDGEPYEDILTFRKNKNSLRAEKKEDKRKNKESLHGNMGLEPILHYLNKFKEVQQSVVQAIEVSEKELHDLQEHIQRVRDNYTVTFSVGADKMVLEAEKRGGKHLINVSDVFEENKIARSLRDLYYKYFRMSEDKLAEIISREDTTEVATKYTCLYILDQLGVSSFEDVNNLNLNNLILSCYRYVSSETEISAPFIKIS